MRERIIGSIRRVKLRNFVSKTRKFVSKKRNFFKNEDFCTKNDESCSLEEMQERSERRTAGLEPFMLENVASAGISTVMNRPEEELEAWAAEASAVVRQRAGGRQLRRIDLPREWCSADCTTAADWCGPLACFVVGKMMYDAWATDDTLYMACYWTSGAEGPPSIGHGGSIASSFADAFRVFAAEVDGSVTLVGSTTETVDVTYKMPAPIHRTQVIEVTVDDEEGARVTPGKRLALRGAVTGPNTDTVHASCTGVLAVRPPLWRL